MAMVENIAEDLLAFVMHCDVVLAKCSSISVGATFSAEQGRCTFVFVIWLF